MEDALLPSDNAGYMDGAIGASTLETCWTVAYEVADTAIALRYLSQSGENLKMASHFRESPAELCPHSNAHQYHWTMSKTWCSISRRGEEPVQDTIGGKHTCVLL